MNVWNAKLLSKPSLKEMSWLDSVAEGEEAYLVLDVTPF